MVAGPSLTLLKCNYTKIYSEYISAIVIYSGNNLTIMNFEMSLNPSNAELNPICHLLALLGAHHILHVSRIRVKHSSLLGEGNKKSM